MTLELSPNVFAILSALVEERAGLSYALRDRESFSEKVLARVREAGFESALDYYYYLRYDDGSRRELEALLDTLVVTETYFFREVDALRVAVDELIAPRVAAGRRPRIWSAACASGEEPLTIAMLLDGAGLLDRVEILASDLSLRALERAQKDGYGPRALRAIPPSFAERYLETRGERARSSPRIAEAIGWRRLNLLDRDAIAALPRFDLVVCRNVLIYFNDTTILRVVASLTSALEPDGRLLVGTSESLMRFGTILECEERSGAFFYRRSGR